jgi:hypothetical protein
MEKGNAALQYGVTMPTTAYNLRMFNSLNQFFQGRDKKNTVLLLLLQKN